MKLKLGYRKIDFGGFSIYAQPLNVKDYQRLARFMSTTFKMTQGEGSFSGLDPITQEDLVDILKELLPKSCRSIEGIEIDDGETTRPADVKDIWEQSGLLQVGFQALTQLLTISSLTDSDADALKKE